MPDVIRLSVRSLVEYVFRSGSIESGFRTAGSLTEGTKAHQKIQKHYGELDLREVYLKTEIVYDDLLFVIEGRCDGLLAEGGDSGSGKAPDAARLTIDEIKSTAGDLAAIGEHSYPVHWAQAKCYAYMVAKERELASIRVQLTYVQVASEEQKRFAAELTFRELEAFMLELVRGYYPFAWQKTGHDRRRNASLKSLLFPFPSYREGQRKLAASVYQSIADGRKLFAKAPTGIGKTMSTLFPALKAIGEGLLQRMIYLTAKTITRTAAEEAYGMLVASGLHLHVVTLTAKDKVCFQEEMNCSREHCPYADGYYDRVNEALLDMLGNETLMTRKQIEHYARKHTVCPFEFSLDAAYAADAIICDYNYVFDPRVQLKRLLEEQKKHTVLLIDEAHNLVDRAREMYSGELNKSDFLAVRREYKGRNAGLQRAAKAVNDYFIALRKQVEGSGVQVEAQRPEGLLELLEDFAEQAQGELLSTGGRDAKLLLDLYYAAQSFIRIGALYDQRYVTYVENLRNEVHIKMFCLDPSHLLKQAGKGYRAQILFSATLSPLRYFMDMLGGDPQDDYSVVVPSPFASEQLEVYIEPLSTRYRDRGQTREPIAALIGKLVAGNPGNSLVFFPSYAYMNDIYELFTAQFQWRTMIQTAGMAEEEREAFLKAFEAESPEPLVAFAVMGGIFSEGIDLVGDRLTAVVVVGVGLPQIGLERDIIKGYFDMQGKDGFAYAYVFPGINKVLQAGGRLIRSEQDRGTLMLIDDRYFEPRYQRLLPPEWKSEDDHSPI
ncbi:ATP-dependent DNA helicase [Paenibacillus nasutitermitis]|uniref:ATP-dependent helicase n=1 Tax=Paenibacillus nasutitermitis TaxID=1652958 RepID=A0A917E2I6_9BACL|nr:ATP-dependent DNA helicase [Paenibacillus nasutitermitis]GGD93437.1 ATP-dependent helicase [Paenibacillus nasutitermitis]